jgi:hypothetical protein
MGGKNNNITLSQIYNIDYCHFEVEKCEVMNSVYNASNSS